MRSPTTVQRRGQVDRPLPPRRGQTTRPRCAFRAPGPTLLGRAGGLAWPSLDAALPRIETADTQRVAAALAHTLTHVGLLDWRLFSGSALDYLDASIQALQVPTESMEPWMQVTMHAHGAIIEWYPTAYSAIFLRETLAEEIALDPSLALAATFAAQVRAAGRPGRMYSHHDATEFAQRMNEYADDDEQEMEYVAPLGMAEMMAAKPLKGRALADALAGLSAEGREKWSLLANAARAARKVAQVGADRVDGRHGVDEFLVDRGHLVPFALLCWHEQDSIQANFDAEFEHANECEFFPCWAAGFPSGDTHRAAEVAAQVRAILAWTVAMDRFLKRVEK